MRKHLITAALLSAVLAVSLAGCSRSTGSTQSQPEQQTQTRIF